MKCKYTGRKIVSPLDDEPIVVGKKYKRVWMDLWGPERELCEATVKVVGVCGKWAVVWHVGRKTGKIHRCGIDDRPWPIAVPLSQIKANTPVDQREVSAPTGGSEEEAQ